MRMKKLNERCERIFDFFSQLDSENNYSREVPIVNLIFSNSLYKQIDKFLSVEEDMTNEIKTEKLIHLVWPIGQVAFAIGYVIGQSFEITSPGAKPDIEAIRKIIREKALLPYLPRERKGGSHEGE
jgi:hypothetical protein